LALKIDKKEHLKREKRASDQKGHSLEKSVGNERQERPTIWDKSVGREGT